MSRDITGDNLLELEQTVALNCTYPLRIDLYLKLAAHPILQC